MILMFFFLCHVSGLAIGVLNLAIVIPQVDEHIMYPFVLLVSIPLGWSYFSDNNEPASPFLLESSIFVGFWYML
jgi:hypothetical protein